MDVDKFYEFKNNSFSLKIKKNQDLTYSAVVNLDPFSFHYCEFTLQRVLANMNLNLTTYSGKPFVDDKKEKDMKYLGEDEFMKELERLFQSSVGYFWYEKPTGNDYSSTKYCIDCKHYNVFLETCWKSSGTKKQKDTCNEFEKVEKK